MSFFANRPVLLVDGSILYSSSQAPEITLRCSIAPFEMLAMAYLSQGSRILNFNQSTD
jgi:hypothetical protein